MLIRRLVFFSLLAFALFWLLFGTEAAQASQFYLDPTSDYETEWYGVLTQVAGTETAGWGATYQAGQTSTAAWTQQWEPVFKTGTPVPTNNYWCPSGLPAGWGTVTPEPWWSMNCGNCNLTLTPPAATMTSIYPTPTGTLTATPTATSVPSSVLKLQVISPISHTDIFEFGGAGHVYQVPILPQHVGKVVGLEMLARENSASDRFSLYYEWGGFWAQVFNFNVGQWYGVHPRTSQSQIESFIGEDLWPGSVTEAQIDSDYRNYYDDAISSQPWDVYRESYVNGALNIDTNQADGFRYVITEAMNWWDHSFRVDTVVWGYLYVGEEEATATPMADFCAVVNNGESSGGGGGGSVDLGIHLPEISVGPASCTTFGGWGFDWTDSPPLPAISFELPSVTLCFQPLSFGSFDLFGVAIDMNLFVTIMGAAVLIRWALRS